MTLLSYLIRNCYEIVLSDPHSTVFSFSFRFICLHFTDLIDSSDIDISCFIFVFICFQIFLKYIQYHFFYRLPSDCFSSFFGVPLFYFLVIKEKSLIAFYRFENLFLCRSFFSYVSITFYIVNICNKTYCLFFLLYVLTLYLIK